MIFFLILKYLFLRFAVYEKNKCIMKKTVVNLLTGALILTALVSVSCGKELPALSIDLQNPAEEEVVELAISQGDTLEIPFKVGALEGFAVSANVECSDKNYQTSVELSNNGASGVVTVIAPDFIFEDATVKVNLTVTDAENSRNQTMEIEVAAKSILENLAVPANCHLVSPGAFVKFAAVKGNSTEKVALASVELLWEDNIDLIDSVFTVSKEELYVNVAAEKTGNAVVCAKNAEGTILWSWHIWVSAEDATANSMEYTYTPAEGASSTYYFMDRNLGALTSELGTDAVNGCFYQWGRKDPFPGSTYEGTIKKIYNKEGVEIQVESATPAVEHNIETAIQNPLTRYCFTSSNSANYAWITNNYNAISWDVVKDLWGGVSKAKTIYDPCPAGYRMPESKAWYFWSDANVAKEKVFSNAESTANADQMGKKVTVGDKAFYFPLQGEVNQGASFAEGYKKSGYGGGATWPNGKQWHSQFDGSSTSSSYFRAYTTNISPTSTSYYQGINLGYAVSVRCVKE